MNSAEVAKQVTQKVLEELRNNPGKWVKSWETTRPRNLITGHEYSGFNWLRVDGPDELDVAGLGPDAVVGVTAGASAPEDLVQAVVAKLAPREGVEPVFVTDETEYFPPPRELRELVPALDALAALLVGGDPQAARAQGGQFTEDRATDASGVLTVLAQR